MDEKTTGPESDQAAVQRIAAEMIEKLLEYAERPDELSKYLTGKIRDLLKADTAVLMRANASEGMPEHAVVNASPEGNRDEVSVPELYRMAEISLGHEHAERWGPDQGPVRAREELGKFSRTNPSWSECYMLPLYFGKNRYGSLFVFGPRKASAFPFSALEPLCHIAALVLKNAILFEEEERIIAQRSRELIRKDRKRQILAELAPVGIAWMDAQGSVVYANEELCRITGRSKLDVLGWDLSESIHPDDKGRVLDKHRACVLSGTPYRDEFRFLRQDGKVVWVITQTAAERDEGDNVTGYVGTVTDVSNLKEAEREISRKKEWLDVTLRSIHEGVITTDASGKILTMNAAAEGMTGFMRAEAIGRPFAEAFSVVDENGDAVDLDLVSRVLASGQPVKSCESARFPAKDGADIYISGLAAPIRDDDGSTLGVVLVFRDVGEQRKLADALQREQRLQALDILAGGIAHDFNNLLSGIFGNIERADRALESGGDAAPFIREALGVFDRAKALTQQLLTFSKGGAPVRKPTDLGKLARQVSQFSVSGSSVSCRFDIPDGLPACDCDENQISQAISNIVLNAVQAMPSGGEALVSVREAGPDWLMLSVRDSGGGIPDTIRERIFDPFFTTKDLGHGLGLATTFSIVQRHGGRIEVDSEPGRGSEFRLFLPASKLSCADPRPDDKAGFSGRGRILVMDDEDFLRELFTAILREMGYEAVAVPGGLEAIELYRKAKESGRGFAAGILDLTVPGGMGGKEAAEMILKIDPDAILVATSGYSQDPIMSDPQSHGFKKGLPKPYRRKDLIQLMTDLGV